MENNRFKNLSAIQICNRMAAICQRSADQTLPGLEQERLQLASDKFRDEADTLALADLQQSSHWHIECSAAKAAGSSASSLDRRMKKGGLEVVKGALGTHNPK
jgi:hypothetical protein